MRIVSVSSCTDHQMVIDALNADMPFDRFTIEQVAGDLLPGAGVDQRIATGFHRNARFNDEQGDDQVGPAEAAAPVGLRPLRYGSHEPPSPPARLPKLCARRRET